MLRLVSLKDFQMSYYRADLPIRCKIYSSGVIFEGGGGKRSFITLRFSPNLFFKVCSCKGLIIII